MSQLVRVVWKGQSTGGRWTHSLGPSCWNGGTCEFRGEILIYSLVPYAIKVEGESLLYQNPYGLRWRELCPLAQVAAFLTSDGKHLLYAPGEPAAS